MPDIACLILTVRSNEKKNQDTMFCCTDKERDDNDNNNHVVLTRIENHRKSLSVLV